MCLSYVHHIKNNSHRSILFKEKIEKKWFSNSNKLKFQHNLQLVQKTRFGAIVEKFLIQNFGIEGYYLLYLLPGLTKKLRFTKVLNLFVCVLVYLTYIMYNCTRTRSIFVFC